MKPTTIRGAEYFPILSETCTAWVGSKEFECAFYRPENDFTCALMEHEPSCYVGPAKNYVIFLSKDDQALAVLLGAEAPA